MLPPQTRALIFAAGRGERMRPLSDTTPKPLLSAAGKRLIDWQIESLHRAGIHEFVVNTAHLAARLEQALGDGSERGLHIVYSREGEQAEDALETLGGIVQARHLLGEAPFIAVSGDIVCDFDYGSLLAPIQAIARGELDAHLVLVPNPAFHPRGDMGLQQGRITTAMPWQTYANIAVLAPRLFTALTPGRQKLFPWLYQFAAAGRVSGELFEGAWHNIGTPNDLAALDRLLTAQAGA